MRHRFALWHALYVENDRDFHVQADAIRDTDHGLTVRVKDWKIEP